MIILRPVAGLCNRLRAIASAMALAKRTQQRLVVYWRTDDEMNARFRNLFNETSAFRVYDIGKEGFLARLFFSKYNCFVNNFGMVGAFIDSFNTTKRILPWVMSSYARFCVNGEDDYSWLDPIPRIKMEIDAFRNKLGNNAIGLHIRRTDNEMSIKHSPLSLFEEKVEAELKADARRKFFLATDDVATKKYMLAKYGDIIVTREHVAKRNDENGVADAVVDLLLLSSCLRVYGSYYSSFSEVSAAIGKIDIVSLCKDCK